MIRFCLSVRFGPSTAKAARTSFGKKSGSRGEDLIDASHRDCHAFKFRSWSANTFSAAAIRASNCFSRVSCSGVGMGVCSCRLIGSSRTSAKKAPKL